MKQCWWLNASFLIDSISLSLLVFGSGFHMSDLSTIFLHSTVAAATLILLASRLFSMEKLPQNIFQKLLRDSQICLMNPCSSKTILALRDRRSLAFLFPVVLSASCVLRTEIFFSVPTSQIVKSVLLTLSTTTMSTTFTGRSLGSCDGKSFGVDDYQSNRSHCCCYSFHVT